MQTNRPHEQARIDRAKSILRNNSQPRSDAMSNVIYTGAQYKHKITNAIYLGVTLPFVHPSHNPCMIWVSDSDRDRFCTIPADLLILQ